MRRKKQGIKPEEDYRSFGFRVNKKMFSLSMKLRKAKEDETCSWCKTTIQKGRVCLKWQDVMVHYVICFSCISLKYEEALKSIQKIRTLILNHRRYFVKNYDKIKEREVIVAL